MGVLSLFILPRALGGRSLVVVRLMGLAVMSRFLSSGSLCRSLIFSTSTRTR